MLCDKGKCEFLTAANARIAELEQHFEQAKDKIAMMGAEIVRLSEGKEQAEASCAAYKKALDIAMSTNQSHETYCKVKAALEEKP